MFNLISIKTLLKSRLSSKLKGFTLISIKLTTVPGKELVQSSLIIEEDSSKKRFEESDKITGKEAQQLIELAEGISEKEQLEKVLLYELECDYTQKGKAKLHIYGIKDSEKIHLIKEV